MKTKAIIFDLYNTLVFIKNRNNPYLDFFKSIGLNNDEIKIWTNRVLTENFNSFEEIKSIIDTNSIIDTSIYNDQVREDINNTYVFADTYYILEELSKKYKLYLISNLATPYKESYRKLNLNMYINKSFFSCDLGYRKPDKEIFDLVIKHSKLSANEIIMIGDSYKSDYLGAKNCGINPILKDDKSLSEIISW